MLTAIQAVSMADMFSLLRVRPLCGSTEIKVNDTLPTQHMHLQITQGRHARAVGHTGCGSI